jgi:hypothetical protein
VHDIRTRPTDRLHPVTVTMVWEPGDDDEGPLVRVKMILPALTEATSPHFRPIKYSLFPPLGLATLAAYLDDADEVTIHDELEDGYWAAYDSFYRWGSIARSAMTKPSTTRRLRHVGYAAGWKKFEPLWDLVIRAKRVGRALPVLESILAGFGTLAADDVGGRSIEMSAGPVAVASADATAVELRQRTA